MTAPGYRPCGSSEHTLGRRQFLGDFLTGAGTLAAGMSLFSHPLGAGEVSKKGKSVVVIYLGGGLSQFDSWHSKTDLETGGPFKSIPTSVPGIHISELLPHTAKQMHHMALVRSMSTGLDDHGLATNIIRSGRTTRTATEYPEFGAVVAKGLERTDSPLPGHIRTMPEGVGGRSNNAAYLGPRYASVNVGAEKGGIVNTQLPDGMTVAIDSRRHDWRRFVNNRHRSRVQSAEMDAYTQSYEQALRMMERRELFDISREPEAVQAGYGTSPFSMQLLLARRLVEQEVPYVEVVERQVDHRHLFHTYLRAVGIDSSGHFDVAGRQFPIADPAYGPIEELLA
ncbi:MAG: DUF1501 domain-containing protein [Planctomycetes bacterium]|nr:DUF1501 domain-containing protein [Planctomycetota bacterium]